MGGAGGEENNAEESEKNNVELACSWKSIARSV